MVSFDNTKIAFAGKSANDLNRAYWLFRLINLNFLVDLSEKMLPLALKLGYPVRKLVKATLFKQFVGGESIEECAAVIKALADRNVKTILDYSLEGKDTESSFEATTAELMRTVEISGSHENIPFSVFKISGIARMDILEKVSRGVQLSNAESREWERVQHRVDSLCKKAYQLKSRILIDAEETWYQPALDDLVTRMMELYNRERAVVFNTLQFYCTDRIAFLRRNLESAKSKGYYAGIKLVRGAYMEKERERAAAKGYPSPIQPDKRSTDHDFNLGLDICMNHLENTAILAGTHNEESCYTLMEMMKARSVPHNHQHVWFGQLLGMSDHISFNLAADGYNVVKYVPYGPVKEVLPYLIRRAQENTSVAGQTGRELTLIMKEKARRKNS